MLPLKSLTEVKSAIATEAARPPAYLQSLLASRDSATIEAKNLAITLDPSPAGIAAAAAVRNQIAGLTAAIEDFQTIGNEQRAKMLGDALCAANKETIGELLEAKYQSFLKAAPGRFEKLGGRLAELARRAIGLNPDPEAVRLAAVESEKLQGDADALNYSLAVAKCGIQNFLADPTQANFEAAAIALQNADVA